MKGLPFLPWKLLTFHSCMCASTPVHIYVKIQLFITSDQAHRVFVLVRLIMQVPSSPKIFKMNQNQTTSNGNPCPSPI